MQTLESPSLLAIRDIKTHSQTPYCYATHEIYLAALTTAATFA